MADTLIKKKEDILLDIEEKLKEEKWTRAAIESYSVKNFIELDSIIRMAMDEGFKDELKNLCRENLKHYQNSVVGLYIIGILSLEESAVDDTHIPQIIKLFMDNKKHKIAEFLAEKILSYRENKFALKTLESVYESNGNQDELFNIKKRLVLIDNRDAGNAKFLGEYYEKENDKDQAMFYYRLAMERHIKMKSIKMIEDLWNKILKLYPEDPAMLISMVRKVREVLGDEKVADMAYNDFVRPMMKAEKYKEALKVLKVIIDFKSVDKQLRKAIEDCYRSLYAEHSQLEKYLKLSAIGQTWKPHREAIRMFETHIAFDKGIFVSHKSWGIGEVKEIQNEKVVVDFTNKKNHEMSLEIALRALEVLDDDNIVIWKSFKADELKKIVKEEPLRAIEIVLRSQNGEATTTDLKNHLVPEIIKESEWNKWWAIAKKQMEGSNTVVQNLSKRNVIELRDSELTMAEEIVSKFKKTTNFENKVKLLLDFVMRGGDINAGFAAALVAYFTEIINATSEPSEKKLLSQLALKYANFAEYNDNSVDTAVIFGVKNLSDFYDALETDLKKPFLLLLMKRLKDWEIKFADFMTRSTFTKMDRFMLGELEIYQKSDVINSIYMTAMNNFQENPEFYVGFTKVIFDDSESSLKEIIGVKESEVIFRLLSLLDILNSEIDAKTNVGRNKKVVDGIEDLLFKKKILAEVVDHADETMAKSLISIIYSTITLPEAEKAEFTGKIIARYPSLKKIDKQEKITIRHPFLVTKVSYQAKKAELSRMMTVDIPENSHAIGEAMEKGDLRENAEYKAALEKQDQLKAAASKLESEINQAKVLEREKVNTSRIDVGTRVVLKTKKSSEKEEYQILGQWDVDFNKKTISYHSPLGKALLDKKIGDTIDFAFNGEIKEFVVENIELADFE